tara:strand:- start:44 stop:1183 length:1140 start_codon:yes stop_codon:yes gene_type:complete
MDNIKAKQDSFSNWRSQFEIDEGKKKGLDGKACWDGYTLKGTKKKGGKTVDNCVKEEVEGGVSVENYADGVQFNEIETVDIIKPEPLNPSNWRNDLNILDEKISKPVIKSAKTGATVGATTGVLKAIDKVTDTTDAALNIMTSALTAGNTQRNKAQSEDERLTKRRIQIANNAVGYTPYVTTSESNVTEGNRTKGYTGSGNKKDYSKGPNEAAPVDYRYLVKDDKKKPSDKIYAGYEPEGKIVENAAVKVLVKGKNLNKLRKGVLKATGLASGIANMMSKTGIPDDINQEPPADIKKELDKPQVVRDRSHGKKLLDDLVGNPMTDKYNKDALDNEKTDSILDPTGDQKTKPSLEQLKKAAKKRRKKVEESNWREEIELG